MRQIDLFTINHNRPPVSPGGGIVTSFIVGTDDAVGDNIIHRPYYYADWQAHYWVWKNRFDLDIVGFQGRRKLFNFTGSDDVVVPLPDFMAYQMWLQEGPRTAIEQILGGTDIFVPKPFDVSYNTNVTEDFKHSASPKDWEALMDIMSKYGEFEFDMTTIMPHSMFITTAPIFRKFMTFWWTIVSELEPRLTVSDAGPGAYHVRPMAYLSERIFSLWLNSSGLKQKTVPLLICWEAP